MPDPVVHLARAGAEFATCPAAEVPARLAAGDVVTTQKNTVDKVVTEYGVAELRGRSVAERARALVAVAHPAFRDDLERQAREIGYW